MKEIKVKNVVISLTKSEEERFKTMIQKALHPRWKDTNTEVTEEGDNNGND